MTTRREFMVGAAGLTFTVLVDGCAAMRTEERSAGAALASAPAGGAKAVNAWASLAQDPQEAGALGRVDADRLAVDAEIDRHVDSFLVRDHATPRAKSRSMLRRHRPRIGCARTLLVAAQRLG